MNIDTYYIVLIVLIIAITVMYIAEKIADIFRAKYKSKGEKNYENTKDFKEE